MAESTAFDCIEMAVFDTSTLTGTYQSLNGAGFEDDIRILKIYNESDTGVTITYDNIRDQDYYPAGATIIIDLQTNHSSNSSYSSGTYRGKKGQVIRGKGTAGTGNLYIIGFR